MGKNNYGRNNICPKYLLDIRVCDISALLPARAQCTTHNDQTWQIPPLKISNDP